MLTARRVVRKVEPSLLATFDDQLWPVNIALVVIAGFVSGAIIATSRFDDPQLLYNGAARLATLGLSVGIFMWLAMVLDRTWIRRQLQLAALLSLILHVALVIALDRQQLRVLVDEEPETVSPAETEVVLLPDYDERPADNEPMEHERPVEADPAVEMPQQERRQPHAQSHLEILALNLPDTRRQVEPRAAQRQLLDQATPAEDRRQAMLNKQVAEAPLTTQRPIAAPRLPAQQLAADKMAPSVASIERKTSNLATAGTVVQEPSLAPASRPSLAARPIAPAQSERPALDAPAVAPARTSRPVLIAQEPAARPPQPVAAAITNMPEVLQTAEAAAPRRIDAPLEFAPLAAVPLGTAHDRGQPPLAEAAAAVRSTGTSDSLAVNLDSRLAPLAKTLRAAMPITTKADAAQIPAGPSLAGSGSREPQAGLPAPAQTEISRSASAAGLSGSVANATSGEPITKSADAAGIAPAPLPANAVAAASSIADQPAVAVGEIRPPAGRVTTGVTLAGASVSASDVPRQANLTETAGAPGGVATAPGPQVGQLTRRTGSAATMALDGPLESPAIAARGARVEVAAALSQANRGGAAQRSGSLQHDGELDVQLAHVGNARFLGRSAAGPLAIDGRARQPAAAFKRRAGGRFGRHSGPDRPSARTEAAIELGLEFLARHQNADGSWSLNDFGAGRPGYAQEFASFHSDAAATGLALLSFLGAGYDHYEDRYSRAVQRGLEYLVKNQKLSGDLYVAADEQSDASGRLYSHGIAAICLCEAYGMTGDTRLHRPAQKAIDFIAAAQDPSRGGWRYQPQVGSDTSVSGWQLMALKSGQLAGLRVSAAVYERARAWLELAQAPDTNGAQYVYNPLATDSPQQAHGRHPTNVMTAVGLLMRLYLGWNRDEPRMVAGAEHLLEHLPAIGTAEQPTRDTYYWYYATQVMFHMRGKYWRTWNERLHPLLVHAQVQSGHMAGSWDPEGPIPDRWGPHGGRIYVTTLNLLSLEVYYRHLPIYESTAK